MVCGSFGLVSTQDLTSALIALALVEPAPADLAPTASSAPVLLLTGRPDVRHCEELTGSLTGQVKVLLAEHTGNQATSILSGAGFAVHVAGRDIAESLSRVSAVRVQ